MKVFFTFCLLALLLHNGAADQVAIVNVLEGHIMLPSSGFRAADATLLLFTSIGEKMTTYCDSAGNFAFYNIPKGSHVVQVHILGLLFPEVQVDVNNRGDIVRAAYNANKAMTLPYPLALRPMAEAQYLEKRKPVDVWSFIKSPYGIMICVSLGAIVFFPMMKVDPEEYKEYSETKPGSSSQTPRPITQGSGRN
jgi:hypothetical protein